MSPNGQNLGVNKMDLKHEIDTYAECIVPDNSAIFVIDSPPILGLYEAEIIGIIFPQELLAGIRYFADRYEFRLDGYKAGRMASRYAELFGYVITDYGIVTSRGNIRYKTITPEMDQYNSINTELFHEILGEY